MFKPNIKALRLSVSDEIKIEFFLLCSYVRSCDPGVGPVLTPGASYEQN